MKFLFWNTRKRDLTVNVARLAANPGANVVLLAESGAAPAAMAAALTAATGTPFAHVPVPGCLVQVYSGAPAGALLTLVSAKRFVIFRMTGPTVGTVLLTAVHLPSKLRYSASTQRVVSSDLAEEIRRREAALGGAPSLLIGDVNMNPFDPGMVEADALHALCSKAEAAQPPRPVNGHRYPMFYNPMWSHMGDGVTKPPGTFYRRTNDNDCIFFHTLDQVLLRPTLVPLLPASGGVRVLETDGVDAFVTARDIPRKSYLSDHLPVHFEIGL